MNRRHVLFVQSQALIAFCLTILPIRPVLVRADDPAPKDTLSGRIVDPNGKPVAGTKIGAMRSRATSDTQDKFILRGFGPRPQFQMRVFKAGYVSGNFAVEGSKDDVKVIDTRADDKTWKMKDMSISRQRVAWMEGRAVDADTGKPVQLGKAVLLQAALPHGR